MDKRFIKGLFKDTAHIDQPESSWRYAKNAVINNKKGSISNEGGTELAGHLGGAPYTGAIKDKVLGKIEVSDDRVILFVKDVVTLLNPRSEIGIWENGVYTIIYNPNVASTGLDLNFQEDWPIEGTFKIDSKGDLVIYFTDDLNPPRAFNVDRQIRESGTNVSQLYGAIPNNIELLNLFPHSGDVPHVELDSVLTHQSSILEGGGLLTGVYYLALAYVDDDFVATNFITVSNPISIVEEFDHTSPTAKKDGAKEGSQTTKSIKWKVNNLNTEYKYLKPVVIRKMGDATEGFRLNDVEINSTNLELSFSGIEGSSPASVEDVIIDTVSYTKAKTIQQLDNVLYIGNLTSTQDLGYQKYANNIKLHSVTKPITNFDEFYATIDNLDSGFNYTRVNEYNGAQQVVDNTKSYRYAPNIFKFKGYMRDEIYAFYIAFILKDGTMSYAYHIPGREGFTQETYSAGGGNQPGDLWGDIKNLNPEYAKNFHFLDRVRTNPGAPSSQHRNMNYWENATETYPNSDDYDIHNGSVITGTLKGGNVRHHHFPSNKNEDRKSISGNVNVETAPSTISSKMPQTWDLEMTFEWSESHSNVGRIYENSWTKYQFNRASYKSNYRPDNFIVGAFTGAAINTTLNDNAAAALWDGKIFTADQQMTVEVKWNIWLHQKIIGLAGIGDVQTKLRTTGDLTSGGTGGSTITVNHDTIGTFGTGAGGCAGARDDLNRQTSASSMIYLEAGQQIWLETKQITSSNDYPVQSNMGSQVGCYAGTWNSYSSNDCGSYNCKSWIAFNVASSASTIPTDDYNDAKITQDVDILGFELSDLKIPQDIASKIQGFRIYHAKRNHANKTVLGQSVMIPATPHIAQIGVCEETANSPDALKILNTLKNEKEDFWNINPFTKNPSDYSKYPIMNIPGGSGIAQKINEEGYKVFSFHDFSLLRTHNSLSSATHIDVQYKVRNLAWQGPRIEQEKKMISKLKQNNSSQIDEIVQEWGWDAVFNCYPQDIKSAIFIGADYVKSSYRMQPRLLNQKAKTYLAGDSIFEGKPLGFGGKLFNEFGESSIVFGLKDNHEIPCTHARAFPYAGSVGWTGSTDFTNAGQYGQQGLGFPLLTNPMPWGPGLGGGNVKSQDLIVNLKAFKTDVYKSIDSQELVWTGFEVLGNELEYFKIGSSAATPHFDTSSLSAVNGEIHEGIFGGDTYICRYGIGTALKPSNPHQESNPERAVHYHIVESTDNINFRHSQDSDSLYFPGAPARKILENAGVRDFSSLINSRYNSNYSELNNLRTAFPLPLKETLQDDFPTRTIRSAKSDSTSLIDNYRIFLANQFKDLPKNRGDLWKLASFNNLLYFHMEESLFAAKGKQQMQMKDGSEAFVGSGDIFAQEPDEIIQTEGGYAGTQSKWAALTTKFGYFFVDAKAKKVFLMGEALQEISSIGMEEWFRDNLSFDLGFSGKTRDNPILGFGFTSIWDPKNKRILLTKRDLKPTAVLTAGLDLGNTSPPTIGKVILDSTRDVYMLFDKSATWVDLEYSNSAYFEKIGWTISYHPESSTWTSFHDYVPYIYFNTSTAFYSLTDKYPRPAFVLGVTNVGNHLGTTYGNAGIWKHNSDTNRGILYQENHAKAVSNADWLELITYSAFEVEFIHNENKASNTLISNISYSAETFNQQGVNILNNGFTDFFLYNTNQISGKHELEYMINTRKIGNKWTINKFRDMAQTSFDTSDYYVSSNPNILGGTNTGTTTTSSTNSMFNVAGMEETINLLYLDLTKTWDKQRKFTDQWVGIRLICDNKQNNLLNLYSTTVGARKVHR